jgi:hypothetical protein
VVLDVVAAAGHVVDDCVSIDANSKAAAAAECYKTQVCEGGDGACGSLRADRRENRGGREGGS